MIRNTEEIGAFLNGVCRNVILEYRRRVEREPTLDPDKPTRDEGVRPDAEVLEMRDAIDNGLTELGERDRSVSSCPLSRRQRKRRYLQGMGNDRFAVSGGPVPGQRAISSRLEPRTETKS